MMKNKRFYRIKRKLTILILLILNSSLSFNQSLVKESKKIMEYYNHQDDNSLNSLFRSYGFSLESKANGNTSNHDKYDDELLYVREVYINENNKKVHDKESVRITQEININDEKQINLLFIQYFNPDLVLFKYEENKTILRSFIDKSIFQNCTDIFEHLNINKVNKNEFYCYSEVDRKYSGIGQYLFSFTEAPIYLNLIKSQAFYVSLMGLDFITNPPSDAYLITKISFVSNYYYNNRDVSNFYYNDLRNKNNIQNLCKNQSFRFSSYKDALEQINATTFKIDEVANTTKSSWIRSASFKSCDGRNGFFIFRTENNLYIHQGMPYEVWVNFKNAYSFGQFYNQNIKGKFQLEIK